MQHILSWVGLVQISWLVVTAVSSAMHIVPGLCLDRLWPSAAKIELCHEWWLDNESKWESWMMTWSVVSVGPSLSITAWLEMHSHHVQECSFLSCLITNYTCLLVSGKMDYHLPAIFSLPSFLLFSVSSITRWFSKSGSLFSNGFLCERCSCCHTTDSSLLPSLFSQNRRGTILIACCWSFACHFCVAFWLKKSLFSIPSLYSERHYVTTSWL